MAKTGEQRPIIYFDLQGVSLEEFAAEQEAGSRVYLELDQVDFHRYHQHGCTLKEMSILILDNMADDRQEETRIASDALDLLASFPIKTIALPAFGPEEDGKFNVALPGLAPSDGEEMSEISFAKTIRDAKKRRNGQA